MHDLIPKNWQSVLGDEFRNEYFIKLEQEILNKYTSTLVFPKKLDIYNALELTSPKQVKVVILGQDPYHGLGQAHGLAFSVTDGEAIPPSLLNIFKEIKSDLGLPIPQSGNLERWAKQGVLLLNNTLTVEAGKPGSHQNLGWETFTNSIIKLISDTNQNVVFMLWGKQALSKRILINEEKHLVLLAPHPSPLSAHRGFFGCQHFSKANTYLKQAGQSEIFW